MNLLLVLCIFGVLGVAIILLGDYVLQQKRIREQLELGEIERLELEAKEKVKPVVKEARELDAKYSFCKFCQHFDLELGQEHMSRFPAFMEAARAVPPDTMGMDVDENGNPIEDTGVPMTCRWAQFGACVEDQVVIWGGDAACPRFVLSDDLEI